MFLSWVAVSVAGALVPPAAALRSAQVTASPASPTKQSPPVVQAGSVVPRVREDRAKSTQKPVPPLVVAFLLSSAMPAVEPVSRVIEQSPFTPPALRVIDEPSGIASQLYSLVVAVLCWLL